MKIIITEGQFDKFKEKMIKSVKQFGFRDTVKMLGINKLKLAEITNLPIKGDTFHNDDEIVVGELLGDLVNKNNKYKNCELTHSYAGTIDWTCRFKDDKNYYDIESYATPYWDSNDKTLLDIVNITITPIGLPEDKDENDVVGDYFMETESPEVFENVDELEEWFEDEYKPWVYNQIVSVLEKYK
jgi:hypothetical protein